MKKINTEELMETKGGIKAVAAAGLVSLAIFIVGVFDGIARPLKCR